MSLFEELAQSFPLETLAPYGQVLVIPVKAFREEWRKQLEAEGVQVYSNAYMGQTCFFLRKKCRIKPFQKLTSLSLKASGQKKRKLSF